MRRQFRFEPEPFEAYSEHEGTAVADEEGWIDPEWEEVEWEEETTSRGSPEYVRWIQQSLNRILRLQLAVDGRMGPQTRSAIRSFQQRHGLPADGVVGPRTEKALVGAGATAPPGAAGAGAARTGTATATVCPERPVDCPPPGAPLEVLDGFAFDKAAIDRARHTPRIERLAQQVISSQRSARPIRALLIAGHTDPVGNDDYNFALGWRRAREVLRELCRALERGSPGLARRVRFDVTSCGERQPKATPPASRRVEIWVPRPAGRKVIPPDASSCGVPPDAARRAGDVARELEELERSGAAQQVRPRLCLFQDASNTVHRNHFQCGASRWARRIAAIASPDAAACRRRVGATPYGTGADIIRRMLAARACARARLGVVHVFSHGSSRGIPGNVDGSLLGLYDVAPDAASRAAGARAVADIPTAPLAENVVFVLHGCRMAEGDDNFARALFQHLSARLRNPRVFGHPDRGCASRDNGWREYSARSPDGRRRLRSLAPIYRAVGCC